MAPMRFRSRLVRPEGVGTWTFAPIPTAVSFRSGLRAHQRVKGTVDGVAFSSSLMPRGGGVFFLVVNGALREQIAKTAGQEVEVAIELDHSPVVVPLPPALKRALGTDPTARKNFEALAPSHRKAYAQWVDAAKKEETRERRVAQALEMLRRGETLN